MNIYSLPLKKKKQIISDVNYLESFVMWIEEALQMTFNWRIICVLVLTNN
jgi:hypothetical protein